MTPEQLLDLAKPICDAVGIDTAQGVTSIELTPETVCVTFLERGQFKTVTERVVRSE